ncbi:MAG: class I SAM-dependent methyltransferase [Solirubrobacteraceae bacterium]
MTGPAALRAELERALRERPFGVRWWDGGLLPATTDHGPVFDVRSAKAIGHLLRAPGQLGLGRAYVTGALDVDDMEAALELVDTWRPSPLDARQRARLAWAATRAAGLRGLPRPVASELRPHGRLHTRARDRRAVTFHYDVSNEFFALFLGPSMTYSCAVFGRGAETLEQAQRAKHELVCAKLDVRRGQSLLDVGCGWGSFAIHAAGEHGVHVTGITLSRPQAALATQRAREAGLADRVHVRVADWRELEDEPFDAIASIGMVEHVGARNIDAYARRLAELLRSGGRALNQGIARLSASHPAASGPFTRHFIFPDGETLHLSRVQLAFERAGLVTEHVEGFAADYAETLRHWARRLDDHLDEARTIAGPERTRVWRLYLRAARRGFETGYSSVYQVLARRP